MNKEGSLFKIDLAGFEHLFPSPQCYTLSRRPLTAQRPVEQPRAVAGRRVGNRSNASGGAG